MVSFSCILISDRHLPRKKLRKTHMAHTPLKAKIVTALNVIIALREVNIITMYEFK